MPAIVSSSSLSRRRRTGSAAQARWTTTEGLEEKGAAARRRREWQRGRGGSTARRRCGSPEMVKGKRGEVRPRTQEMGKVRRSPDGEEEARRRSQGRRMGKRGRDATKVAEDAEGEMRRSQAGELRRSVVLSSSPPRRRWEGEGRRYPLEVLPEMAKRSGGGTRRPDPAVEGGASEGHLPGSMAEGRSSAPTVEAMSNPLFSSRRRTKGLRDTMIRRWEALNRGTTRGSRTNAVRYSLAIQFTNSLTSKQRHS
jgi:hypothetical protein